MKYGLIIPAVILALLPAVAQADILQWTDTAGITHYTNLKGEVPSQQAVQVVVDEQVWVPRGPAVPDVKEEPVAQTEPSPDGQDEVLRAYLAGLQSGIGRDISAGDSVYISGPLAVAVSSPTPYGSYAAPQYDWLFPSYYPFWATAGIGRHRGPVHGRFGHGFRRHFPISHPSFGPAGPPSFGPATPFGPAGPPSFGPATPFGPAGPPSFGPATSFGPAGPPSFGAAGPSSFGAAGRPLPDLPGSRLRR